MEVMTRKTRVEKKISQTRKKMKLLQQLDIHEFSTTPPPNEITNLIKIQELPVKQIEIKPEEASGKNYFIQDLKKSLIVIAGIITLEIIIYFVSIKDYLRLGF